MSDKTDLSKLTVCVVDCGLFVSIARKLGQTFGKVYYHVPWISAFPKMNQAFIGYGCPEIELLEDPFGDAFDEIDLWCFFDDYFGPMQVYLASLGKRVWGARMGEEMELDRVGAKKMMKRLGLPVGPYEVVHGMAALREYLKAHRDVYVKVSKWRGTFESFHATDYKAIEPKLDEVEYNLGPFKYILDFVVEAALPDKVEVGIDAYSVDGRYPSSLMSGIEIKDQAYAGIFRPYRELPRPLTQFSDAISPVLRNYSYRGFLSTEVRVGRDQKPYMIDACTRAGSPPSEIYQEQYTNLAEIIWQGAGGVLVDPIPLAKFCAQAMIGSTWSDKNSQPIDFPPEIARNVKLRNTAIINGRVYAIPQSQGLEAVGAVIGWGDTLEAAIQMVRDASAKVSGYYLDIKTAALDDAQEEIDKANEMGVRMFP